MPAWKPQFDDFFSFWWFLGAGARPSVIIRWIVRRSGQVDNGPVDLPSECLLLQQLDLYITMNKVYNLQDDQVATFINLLVDIKRRFKIINLKSLIYAELDYLAWIVVKI